MKIDKIKKIQTVLLVIAIIVFIVGSVLSFKEGQRRAHDVNYISIELISSESRYDDSKCYVYADFRVANNTDATIEYMEFITTVKDGEKIIGTVTYTFGSTLSFGNNNLGLESGNSSVITASISEYASSKYWSDIFHSLYYNGFESYTVEHEITRVYWEDEYDWRVE